MTNENIFSSHPGTIALLGSGEYLPVMNEVDAFLLKTLALKTPVATQPTRVALLPTASGQELMGPKSWNDLGMHHFQQLGVSEIRATRIIDRASANDPAQVALLEGCNLFYFSGGDPNYVITALRASLAWQSIQAAYERGAVLAGCSAGAMMLGGYISSRPRILIGTQPEVLAALAIIPHLIIFPHFDRMRGTLNLERFQHLFRSISPGHTIVGIDEETALVRVELAAQGSRQDLWRVMGRQTVTVFADTLPKHVLKSGDEILL